MTLALPLLFDGVSISYLTSHVKPLTLIIFTGMIRPMITRNQAVKLFGSVKALQHALGLKTHSAIYMWPKHGAIPESQEMRIRYQLKPEAFKMNGELKAVWQ